MYAQGPLENSSLISYPQTILDSRVRIKWDVTADAIRALDLFFRSRYGKGIDLTIVFANKAVLLGHEPSDSDEESLAYHDELYRHMVSQFSDEAELPVTYTTFDELGVMVPTFTPTGLPVPTNRRLVDTNEFINALNDYVAHHNLPQEASVIPNKDSRGVVRDLLKGDDPLTIFWLTLGYEAFDFMIPKIVGPNGLYLSVERSDKLFRIAKLTETVRKMPRLEIKPR